MYILQFFNFKTFCFYLCISELRQIVNCFLLVSCYCHLLIKYFLILWDRPNLCHAVPLSPQPVWAFHHVCLCTWDRWVGSALHDIGISHHIMCHNNLIIVLFNHEGILIIETMAPVFNRNNVDCFQCVWYMNGICR